MIRSLNLPQYCISVMPDDVRQQILRSREQRANLADDESSETEFVAAAIHNPHFALAVRDLPTELNLDTIDPIIRESFVDSYATPHVPIHETAFAVPHHTPPSPTITVNTGTPKKEKKKKKKRKSSATVEEVATALHQMSLKEEEISSDEFSM
jgi:hypothetical protein